MSYEENKKNLDLVRQIADDYFNMKYRVEKAEALAENAQRQVREVNHLDWQRAEVLKQQNEEWRHMAIKLSRIVLDLGFDFPSDPALPYGIKHINRRTGEGRWDYEYVQVGDWEPINFGNVVGPDWYFNQRAAIVEAMTDEMREYAQAKLDEVKKHVDEVVFNEEQARRDWMEGKI